MSYLAVTLEELRSRSLSELRSELKAQQHALWKLRFENGAGQLKSTSDITRARRAVARIHTLIAEQQRRNEVQN